MAKKKDANKEINVLKVEEGRVIVCVKGVKPLICEAMSFKVKQGLLLPAPRRRTAADRAQSLKHQPMQEFRDSMYLTKEDKSPTRITGPAMWFKKGISGVSVDMPGVTKAAIGRLVHVDGDLVHGDMVSIYGVPQLKMDGVRCADINHTPDIRTRAILPEWACKISITYTKPLVREQTVVNLLAAAGMINGCGGWRSEKGSKRYGSYEMVSADDADFKRIVKAGGRKEQDKAIAEPVCYDEETMKLLSWFEEEIERRGFKLTA